MDLDSAAPCRILDLDLLIITKKVICSPKNRQAEIEPEAIRERLRSLEGKQLMPLFKALWEALPQPIRREGGRDWRAGDG